MANHAANGIAISSPTVYAVESQDASSRPKPSAPRTSASASAPTRLFSPAIIAARKMPTSPAMGRIEGLPGAVSTTGEPDGCGNVLPVIARPQSERQPVQDLQPDLPARCVQKQPQWAATQVRV